MVRNSMLASESFLYVMTFTELFTMIYICGLRNLSDGNAKMGSVNATKEFRLILKEIWKNISTGVILEILLIIFNVPSENIFNHCVVSSSIGQTTWILYFTARGFFIYQKRGCWWTLEGSPGGVPRWLLKKKCHFREWK